MTEAERAQRIKQLEEATKRLRAERVAAGQCRHCGGPVPCYSEFGDQAIGKRHTPASHRRAKNARGV